MKKLPIIATFALLAVVACNQSQSNAPQAHVEEATPAAEAVAEVESRAVLPLSGTVGFTGAKITGTHEGGFKTISGEILAGETAEASAVNVEIDVTSLWSDSDNLTGHLKSPDFFDAEKFPTASFKSTAITATDTGHTITGDLDLHGITKSITFPATIEFSADSIGAKAEFAVKRFDFGIVYPGKAENLIKDDVVIRLDVTAAKPAA